MARKEENVLKRFLRYGSHDEEETWESGDPMFTRYVTVKQCNWWLDKKRCGITVEQLSKMLERDRYYKLYYTGWEVSWISIKKSLDPRSTFGASVASAAKRPCLKGRRPLAATTSIVSGTNFAIARIFGSWRAGPSARSTDVLRDPGRPLATRSSGLRDLGRPLATRSWVGRWRREPMVAPKFQEQACKD